MKVSRKLLKNTGKIIAILVLIPVVFFLVYAVIRVNGKAKLYKKNETAAPVLQSTTSSIEVELMERDDSYDWKEGDIKYKDSIYRYNDEILTFLVMGIDKKGKVPTGETTDYMDGGQADALFLVVMNPSTEEVNIVAINRNTVVDVDTYNHDGSFNATIPLQITLQHGYGDGRNLSCERQLAVVSKLFKDIPIHGYVAINMGAIPEINDAVGGVPVVVEENSAYKSSLLKNNVGKEVILKGNDAYEYIHNRDTNEFDSAGKRLGRQKQYLLKFIDRAKQKTKEDISFPITMYNKIADYVVTDVSVSEIGYIASESLGYKFNKDKIYSLEGETVQPGEFEEFYPDEEALFDLIVEIFYKQVK